MRLDNESHIEKIFRFFEDLQRAERVPPTYFSGKISDLKFQYWETLELIEREFVFLKPFYDRLAVRVSLAMDNLDTWTKD
ncbi:hypothetical protein HYX16_01310 [Candidatus Woesearchaeota archaeon]|nr:hypothetical protein [Candidatus Woesearchaeota archaeon]